MALLTLSSAKLPYRKAKELLSQNFVSQCQIIVSVILRNFPAALGVGIILFLDMRVGTLKPLLFHSTVEESACSSAQFLVVEQPQ
jgi:hypothetical protein